MLQVLISFITNPIIIFIFILDILLIIIYPHFTGFMGEFWVKKQLKKLDKKEYLILNDIMINDNNATHQIDHIVISRYGIFVIETKNYSGIIKGNKYSNEWVQILGRNKYYFKNPLFQNYGHIKSLSNVLNMDEKYFISIICFSNRSQLKLIDVNVINLYILIETIKKYKQPIIENDIYELKKIILQNNIVDGEVRQNHVINIRKKLKEQNELVKNNICPKCGGKLVQKQSKYGYFLGCSNYPKCHYIKNIK